MKDEELVKMFNPTLKRKEIILFFLIVMINRLIWIDLNIGLDMCARGRWRAINPLNGQSVWAYSLVQIVLCNFSF